MRTRAGTFADRGLKLATTFDGAGVVHGDLTPECAEVVGRGAGRAVRPGRARRMTGPGISGTTTRCRRRCANCENAS